VPPVPSTLKHQLQRELNLPWNSVHSGDLSGISNPPAASDKKRHAAVSIREPVIRVIEDVEEFGSELQIDAFVKPCVLQYSEVSIEEVGASQGVATEIAERPRSLQNKAAGIEPFVHLSDLHLAAGNVVRPRRQRYRCSAGGFVVAILDVLRQGTRCREDSTDLPSPNECVTFESQGPQSVDLEHVREIMGAHRFIRREVIRIRKVSRAICIETAQVCAVVDAVVTVARLAKPGGFRI